MSRKADPPSRRPVRRSSARRAQTAGPRPPQSQTAGKAAAADARADCDFGLALCVVPALRRRPDA